MKLSQMIAILQEAMDISGDKEVNMWLDSGEDTQYPARVKQLEISIMPSEEFDDHYILESERDSYFLNLGDYDEGEDSLYWI